MTFIGRLFGQKKDDIVLRDIDVSLSLEEQAYVAVDEKYRSSLVDDLTALSRQEKALNTEILVRTKRLAEVRRAKSALMAACSHLSSDVTL